MRSEKNILSPVLRQRLILFANTFIKDISYAEDVVQDVQLKLLTKEEIFLNVKNKEAFLFRMVRNRCLDLIKSKNANYLPLEVDMNAEIQDLMQHIENRDMSIVIKHLMQNLPEKQRNVIYLTDVEQMDSEEIEKIMALEATAVRVDLSRARKKIREQLLKICAYGTS